MLSQESKQKWKKIKIGIFTAMFLMQYFCLHSIVPFSKSYPLTECTWLTARCRGRKSFDTRYYIVTCATLCVSFSLKSKAIFFPKHILKLKARHQSTQAKKKLFSHMIVRNYLCYVSWKFWSKLKALGDSNRTPAGFTVPW